MAREIIFSQDDYAGANPLYFVAYRVSDSYYINGTSLEAKDDAHWTNYARLLTLDNSTGEYFADFPAVAQDTYFVTIYEQTGAQPAENADNALSEGEFDWNPTPPSDVTAAEMVIALKSALRKNPGAVLTVVVDGQTITYNRAQAIEELKFWQREAAKEGSTRPRTARIRLDTQW